MGTAGNRGYCPGHPDPQLMSPPQTDPVTIRDIGGRAVRNAVRVWSNIPAVRRYFLRSTPPGAMRDLGHVQQLSAQLRGYVWWAFEATPKILGTLEVRDIPSTVGTFS